MNKSSATLNISSARVNISSALKYWQDELRTHSETTREIYLKDFNKFLEYTKQTADELLRQREEDQTSKDRKTQRRIESLLNDFIASEREKGLAPATLQTYFASVRSFFEIHYCPLRMRRKDYPTGESIGVRIATKQAILKAVDQKATRHKAITNAIILIAKDSGLRASDLRLLNYGDIAKGLENGDKIIPITRITQKVKTVAKTFIGEESVNALKIYLNQRRSGTRRMPPEELTDTSPLFAKWTCKNPKRMPRTTLSNIIRNAFMRVNEPNISAHSLRKYVQTNLEQAGVNTNWIDQILGHKLINSRDAYSKPTDEQLKEAYTKAYKFLKVYPADVVKLESTRRPEPQPETERATQEEYIVKRATTVEEATELIAEGYFYAMEMDGIKLFRKRR